MSLPAIILTVRQLAVLRKMRDEDEELVYERGSGYVGTNRISAMTVFALLRAAAVSMDQGSTVGKFERYTINETGREILNTTFGPKAGLNK